MEIYPMQEHYKEFLTYCSSRVYNEVGTIGGAIASHTKYINHLY